MHKIGKEGQIQVTIKRMNLQETMEKYVYKPKRFYSIVFVATWGLWIPAIFIKSEIAMVFMILGLLAPAVTAVITVLASGNKQLKDDFKRKIVGFYRIKPGIIAIAVLMFFAAVLLSLATSVIFGGSVEQFSFTEDFSFSIAGSSALLTIILASTIEELGWRGYGEDAIGSYHTWFKESIIFGCIWACWHLPLFMIEGTYQYSLTKMGPLYVINFLVSVIPLDFIQTWVYVKNNRSMLATIIFHLFINIAQEKIAMTPETKCIETIFITILAIIIVLTNRDMFFDNKHIGHMLE